MDSSRLGVGVMGAGKIGPVLASALAGAGHAIVGITPPSDDPERVEAMLEGVPFLTPQEICERSELVLLALPDSELPGFVEGVAATHGWRSGQIVAHTSIVHGLDVLQPAVAQGTSFSHTTIEEAAARLRQAGVANPGVVMAALVGSSVDNALRAVSGNDVEQGQE